MITTEQHFGPAAVDSRLPLSFAIAVVATFVLVGMRYHALDLPLETDECNYAYIGARLLDGDRLYVDVWDHQPPGVFVLFAGVIALFGDAPEVFRWLACGFSVASLWLIWAILGRIARSGTAALGAILFALVSSDPGTAGEGCQREIYMNTLILAAWYCALRGNASKRNHIWLFAAGMCLAMASSLKTIVAVHWLALTVWLMISPNRSGTATEDSPGWSKVLLGMALGPFLLWGVVFGYFGLTARWLEFIDAVFLFNVGYSESAKGFFSRFSQFFTPDRHPFIFESAMPIWIAGGLATIWLGIRSLFRHDRRAAGIALLVIASYVAICLPARFWPHYYFLLIGPLVMAIALTVHQISLIISNIQPTRMPLIRWTPRIRVATGIATAVLYVSVPIALAATQYRHYVSQLPFGITVKRYNSRDFWGRGQGENVRRVIEPTDTIFVYGNDASIYYYSDRLCASRYTMITGLAEGMRGAEERRRILMEEITRNRPRLILAIEPPFPGWVEFINAGYEQVGMDLHDKTRKPIIYVFANKQRPIETIDWDWDRSAVGGWNLGDRP